jgi:hypothetical protein
MHVNKQSQTDTGNYCGPVCLHAAHTTFLPSLHQGSIQGTDTWIRLAMESRKITCKLIKCMEKWYKAMLFVMKFEKNRGMKYYKLWY